MPGWTSVDTHPTQGRTFQRPLDGCELTFLWNGLFNGTSDHIQYYELHLSNGPRDAHLFSVASIVNAWTSTKRRFPLAGATVRGVNTALSLDPAANSEAEGGYGHGSENGAEFMSKPHFVVRERNLSVLRPGEIIFGRVSSAEEARGRAAALMDGLRPLSEELLVQLYVFRETSHERTEVLHLITLIAHCVTDVVASNTLVRCLLDTLARGGEPDSEPAQVPLEERLAMAVPSVEVEPIRLRSMSPGRRRWRRAIGIVIFQLRMAKRKGGHTLPCRLRRSTPHVAARSAQIITGFTPMESAAVISNCRLLGITFGNAYPALAQVAMTRVLYRRYLRGEISEEEWAYRKRQPYITGGPVNLRPYLDKGWLKKGGGGEFMLSVGFFAYQLPFMTLGTTAERDWKRRIPSDGAPPFSDLLTFDRFLHRARLVEKQVKEFFSHPLFLELARATTLLDVENARLNALRWKKREAGIAKGNGVNEDEDDVLAVMDMPTVAAPRGSSVGDMNLISPFEYPLPPTHPLSPYSPAPHPVRAGYVNPPPPSPHTSEADSAPKIGVEYATALLHTRPSDLYLGAASMRTRLGMFASYDGNVFEDTVVKEWLDEVKAAVLWYLGRTHQSHKAGHRNRLGKSVQAKL